jgi:hypothetical protein
MQLWEFQHRQWMVHLFIYSTVKQFQTRQGVNLAKQALSSSNGPFESHFHRNLKTALWQPKDLIDYKRLTVTMRDVSFKSLYTCYSLYAERMRWGMTLQCHQCRRDGGKAGTNYRSPAFRKGTQDPTIIIICRLYKLTISDQAPVTLQLRVSLPDFV